MSMIRRSKSANVIGKAKETHSSTMLIRVKVSATRIIQLEIQPHKDVHTLKHLILDQQSGATSKDPTPRNSTRRRSSSSTASRWNSSAEAFGLTRTMSSVGRNLPRLFCQGHELTNTMSVGDLTTSSHTAREKVSANQTPSCSPCIPPAGPLAGETHCAQ
jgi:hypothetical protein